jgi:cytochrome c-type biogenesis protein CcmH
MRLLIFYIILGLLLPFSASAFSMDKSLENPSQESRARDLFREIRCIVCVSQPIAESDTDLARDLRNLIRKRIIEGETNKQIKTYLVSRYGEQILLSPPLKQSTILLWVTPIIFILIGIVFLVLLTNRKTKK